MMNVRLKLFGICVAAGLMATATVETALSDNELHMHIDNQSQDTLYYETGVGVEDAPETIPAGEDSGAIKGPHKGDGGDGQATYINNQNPADATCKVTLGYGYEYNDTTDHCDNKTFNISDTAGQCTLVKDGDCEGAGSCDCTFKFTMP